jgi:hypothetical protein
MGEEVMICSFHHNKNGKQKQPNEKQSIENNACNNRTVEDSSP